MVIAFEELKQRQSKVWGTGPYERLPEHYTPLLDHLARAAAPRPGEKVLDVACGTGALATRLAAPGAAVTGLDLAPALIDTANRLAAERDLSVDYQVGDAENMPFQWGDRDYVANLLGEAFELRYEEGDAPQRGESGEDVWQLFATVYGPVRVLAESLDPEQR